MKVDTPLNQKPTKEIYIRCAKNNRCYVRRGRIILQRKTNYKVFIVFIIKDTARKTDSVYKCERKREREGGKEKHCISKEE